MYRSITIIADQTWPNLTVVPDLPGRGAGVLTTSSRKKGDVSEPVFYHNSGLV